VFAQLDVADTFADAIAHAVTYASANLLLRGDLQ
jgi:hypothetical protein